MGSSRTESSDWSGSARNRTSNGRSVEVCRLPSPYPKFTRIDCPVGWPRLSLTSERIREWEAPVSHRPSTEITCPDAARTRRFSKGRRGNLRRRLRRSSDPAASYASAVSTTASGEEDAFPLITPKKDGRSFDGGSRFGSPGGNGASSPPARWAGGPSRSEGPSAFQLEVARTRSATAFHFLPTSTHWFF